MPRSFDDIYQIAPPGAVKRLTAFRETHPCRTYEKEGMLYRVWDLGQGEDAVLFLPSGMGNGEIYFPYLLEMSRRRRCIAVSLPECKHMADFARQIHGILCEDLGVRRVTVVGSAIGGLLAQVYVRAYPAETEGLILCTTGAPCKDLPREDCVRWTSRKSLVLRYPVCLLSKLHEAKHHVNVRLDMDELDLTSAESKATYEEIKAYVAEHNDGMKVSNLYIAQVKAKYGIIERENYNKPKSNYNRQPRCPSEKETAIRDALKFYKII